MHRGRDAREQRTAVSTDPLSLISQVFSWTPPPGTQAPAFIVKNFEAFGPEPRLRTQLSILYAFY
jgi:hypothetical protein